MAATQSQSLDIWSRDWVCFVCELLTASPDAPLMTCHSCGRVVHQTCLYETVADSVAEAAEINACIAASETSPPVIPAVQSPEPPVTAAAEEDVSLTPPAEAIRDDPMADTSDGQPLVGCSQLSANESAVEAFDSQTELSWRSSQASTSTSGSGSSSGHSIGSQILPITVSDEEFECYRCRRLHFAAGLGLRPAVTQRDGSATSGQNGSQRMTRVSNRYPFRSQTDRWSQPNDKKYDVTVVREYLMPKVDLIDGYRPDDPDLKLFHKMKSRRTSDTESMDIWNHLMKKFVTNFGAK